MTNDIVNLAYIDTIKDCTLLLIHGFPFNSMMWWPQINKLDETARVIAPDLRGFGESETPTDNYSMRVFADDCRALLDSIGAQAPIIVCGLSMGGYIAFEFCRQHPDRVDGLILTATRAAPDAPADQQGRDRAIETVKANGVNVLARGLLSKLFSDHNYEHQRDVVESVQQMMESATEHGVIGALAAMRDRADSRPMLGEIDVPTLIVHGADDKIVPLDEARTMANSIPNSEMVVIPNAGHLPNLEQPAMWNEAVTQFLMHHFLPTPFLADV